MVTGKEPAYTESVQERKEVEEEALCAALQGRAQRTDDECLRRTLSTREQLVEEDQLVDPTIGGWVWEGATLPPSEREEEELSWPPFRARQEK